MKPASPRTPRAPSGVLSQDRTVRVLMTLVDDLTVEREEQGLLRSTLEHAVRALGVGGGRTFLLDGDRLALASEYLTPRSEPCAEADFARRALDAGRSLVQELPGGGWVAATPLRARERLLGVLALHDQAPEGLAPDLELLEALGKQIGTGIENARHYADLRAASERSEVLKRLTATLASGLELQQLVPAFARELQGFQRFDRLACAFVNDSGDYLELTTQPEQAGWGLGSVVPVVGSGPGFAVLNNRSVLQRDVLREHRFIEDMRLLEEGLRSYLLLPLVARGRAIGVLALGAAAPETYDEAALARLQPLADELALAFENVRLFQRTRDLSIMDDVTPLYNFRFFHQMLERELRLVDRYHSVLSLIFVDLDRFKPINDQHGHLRGSRVLREVGFLIRAAVRESDYPARYGGDEFVVVLPQTERAGAEVLAEKLRALIEGHTFLQEEGIHARLGCSLGIASYPVDANTKEALIRLADERMYADKDERKGGR